MLFNCRKERFLPFREIANSRETHRGSMIAITLFIDAVAVSYLLNAQASSALDLQ